MKKRFLIPLFILGIGAIGTATGFAINAYYQNKANETSIAIQSEQQIQQDESLTEEEKSKLQIIIEQLTKKYNEIKDLQVAGTTIGAIAGSVVGAIVSAIPAIINRSNLHKAIGEMDLVREVVNKNEEFKTAALDDYNALKSDYKKAIETIKSLEEKLKDSATTSQKIIEQNILLISDFQSVKSLLLAIIAHNPNLVSDGSAEELLKKYITK